MMKMTTLLAVVLGLMATGRAAGQTPDLIVPAQSPASAEVAGLRPARWDALFLALMTIVLMLGTSALGTVMALVMIFLPAAIVLPWCRRIPAALIASASIALLLLAIGFILSNVMDWPLSQSVGGTGSVILMLSHVARQLIRR